MSGVSLTALAAQIKKSNKDLVTANSLTKEEKLALKRKRRAEIAKRDQEKLENAAATKLQSIFRGRHAKRLAELERQRLRYILTQSTRFKKTQKHVAGLLRSVQRNYEACTDLLLQEESKENDIREAQKENALNDEIWPLIYKAQKLGTQAFDKKLALTVLRRSGNDILNRPVHVDGRTLLHRCCYKGYTTACKILLSLGAMPTVYDKEGRQPLHVASYYGETEIVVLLLEYGAKANSVEQKESSTSLHLACYENRLKTATLLIDVGGASILAKDCRGITPLHAAAYRGNIEIIHLLLDRCKAGSKGQTQKVSTYDVTASQSMRGVTPLMCCSYFRYRDIMILLTKHMSRASLGLKDEDGNTASAYARYGASREVVMSSMRVIRDPLTFSEA